MKSIRVATLSCVFLMTGTVFGQTQANFRNDLNDPINVILTNLADGSETTVEIARGALGTFNIPAGARQFDIRVMPQDGTGTGFRFDDRDLVTIATNNPDEIPLSGIFKCTKFVRYGLFKRKCCCCKRERVAVVLKERDASGQIHRSIAPVIKYE